MTWRKTRWSLLVVAAALAGEGCTGFGENCSTDADCRLQNAESICDPSLKVCFVYDGPVVTDIQPADQATNVATANGQVVATFSRPIVDAGVTATTFQVVGQGFDTFGGYLVDVGSTHATFEPLAGGLALGTNYTVNLTAGIEDGAGKTLLPFSSTFSTQDGAFGQGQTLRFATQTGAYIMAGNYFGNIITAVDVYTGGGISFDYELQVGISDAGSNPTVTTVLQNIVGQETNNLSTAIAPDETAFVAWTTQPTDAGTPLTYTAMVAAYDPGTHSWGSNTTLAGPDPTPQFPLVVAFNAANGDDGLAVWLQTKSGKQVVDGSYHAGGVWLEAFSFQTNDTLNASNISIAADFAGNALVAWQSEQLGGGPSEILAVYSAIGESPGAPVVVSNPTVTAVVPQVALGITGFGAIVWPQQTLQTDGGILTSHVFASTFDPTVLSLGTPVQLDAAATFADFPQVGVSANGNIFAFWQELGAVVASTYTHATNSWSSPVTLDSDPTFAVNGPAVAVDPGGNAIAAWLRFTPDAGYQMFGGRYTADAGWHGKTQLIVAGTDPVLDIIPTLTVDAMGRSFALETRLPGDTLYLEYIPFK